MKFYFFLYSDARVVGILGGSLTSLGFLLSAFSKEIWHLWKKFKIDAIQFYCIVLNNLKTKQIKNLEILKQAKY